MNKIEIEVPEGKELDHVVWKDKDYDFMPAHEQEYYFCIDSHVNSFAYLDDDADRTLISSHNFFKTKKEAEKFMRLRKEASMIIRACILVDPDFEPDWNNPDQEKWFIFYCCNLGSYDDSVTHSEIHAPSYVSSSAKAREAIKLIDKWKNEQNNKAC